MCLKLFVADSLKRIKTKIWRIQIQIFWRFQCREQVNHVIHYRVTNIHFWKFSPLLKKNMIDGFYRLLYLLFPHEMWWVLYKWVNIWRTYSFLFKNHVQLSVYLFLLVWISYASFVSLGNKQMNQDKSHKIYKS